MDLSKYEKHNLLPFTDKDMDKALLTKVRLPVPKSRQAEKGIAGEGMWAECLDALDHAKVMDDSYTGELYIILRNDAVSLPLQSGHIIKVNCKGENRPEVDLKWLEDFINEQLSAEEKIQLL